MKNMAFESNRIGVANYLAQRENRFHVKVSTEAVILRNVDKQEYEQKLDEVKLDMGYRINLFVGMNKVKVVLPKRKYTVALWYLNNKHANPQFKFIFPETILTFDLSFEAYQMNFDGAAELVDSKIAEQITEDVYSIFDEQIYTVDDNGKKTFGSETLYVEEPLTTNVTSVYDFS